MDQEQFARELQALRARTHSWGRAAVPLTCSKDLGELGEELHVALEELETAEEELRRQNSELELAREAAEAERRRYQDLFYFAPDGYLVTDLEGTVCEANRAASLLLRVPACFLVGKPLVLFIAPEDRLTFRTELMVRLSETNRVDELLLRMQPRGDASFAAALTVAVTTDRRGAPSGLRWLVRDASGRRAATAARVRYQDPTPHALFEQAPSGMAQLGPEGGWLSANHKVCELLGYDRVELTRLNLQDVTHPDDRAEAAERLHALKIGEVLSCAAESRWLHRDGRVLKVRWRASPLVEASGARVGAIVVIEEAGGPVEQGLQTQVEQLTDADRCKDEFLAFLAHELRNPLAPLALSLQILRRSSDAAAGPALAAAEHQVQKLTRLVEELLDVLRIRLGKTDLRLERVELAAVTAGAVETVRPLLDERRHTLEVALPPEPVWLEADAVRLEQVLTNLLTNAAKYTEPGGRITLRAERDGDQVVVRVRDTGVGLALDLLPRVFEPFVQSERNRHRARGGLGLGLSLVKRFVELHGGSVEVRSDGPGRGSEFLVRLPVPLPRAEKAPPAAGATADGPVSVLIVEDNKGAADSLAQLIRLWGHPVTAVYDGPAALAAARVNPPDVVLMDLGLPGMDGYETLQRLREEVKLEAVAAALTGFGGEEECASVRKAGFEHHLVKPVNLAALKEMLAHVGARGPFANGIARPR